MLDQGSEVVHINTYLFLSDEGPMLETLDYTIRIGSTATFLYFDLYLYSAYAAHYVSFTYKYGYTRYHLITHRFLVLAFAPNWTTEIAYRVENAVKKWITFRKRFVFGVRSACQLNIKTVEFLKRLSLT